MIIAGRRRRRRRKAGKDSRLSVRVYNMYFKHVYCTYIYVCTHYTHKHAHKNTHTHILQHVLQEEEKEREGRGGKDIQ